MTILLHKNGTFSIEGKKKVYNFSELNKMELEMMKESKNVFKFKIQKWVRTKAYFVARIASLISKSKQVSKKDVLFVIEDLLKCDTKDMDSSKDIDIYIDPEFNLSSLAKKTIRIWIANLLSKMNVSSEVEFDKKMRIINDNLKINSNMSVGNLVFSNFYYLYNKGLDQDTIIKILTPTDKVDYVFEKLNAQFNELKRINMVDAYLTTEINLINKYTFKGLNKDDILKFLLAKNLIIESYNSDVRFMTKLYILKND